MYIKIISWNVNGLQGILKKKVEDFDLLQNLLLRKDPDILCLQEIKCSIKFQWKPDKRYTYANYCTTKKGYSGTLISSKIKPINVTYGLPNIDNDEGRVISAEFQEFFLVNIYTPNTGSGRIKYRTEIFEPNLRLHVQTLQSKKPVIIIGDFNCTYKDIDMGLNKSIPGSSQGEKECFSQLLECGLTDTFRKLYPKEKIYSWFYPWDKKKLKGCRFDYCLVSNCLNKFVKESEILNYEGSDHLPIFVELDLNDNDDDVEIVFESDDEN